MRIRTCMIAVVIMALLIILTSCGQGDMETNSPENAADNTARQFTLEDAEAMFSMEDGETNAEYSARIYESTAQLKENISSLHDEIIEALLKQYRTSLSNIQPYRTEEEFRNDFLDDFENYYQKLLEAAVEGEEAYCDLVAVKYYGGTGAGAESALWIYTMYYNINEELEMVLSYTVE